MIGNNVLTSFQLPESLYADDVNAILRVTQERFGIREWRLVVLTNEIHGHLGIYSTIGVKMGLRVKEILEAEGYAEEPDIVSYAGSNPPVSCMNDGLQVSTGSTLGHGLISIADTDKANPSALISYAKGNHNLSFRIELKEEYRKQIEEDILKGVNMYGHTEPYWKYIRQLALKYWSTWDRKEIFTLKA